MKNLELFAGAWVLMLGLSYIIVAIFTPNISDMNPLAYIMLGSVFLFALVLEHLAYDKLGHFFVRILWIGLGILMTYGGITSWAGIAIWNVPFPNKEIFQVSMACMDLLSAVFMFVLALHE